MKWLNRTLVTSPYCYAICTDEAEFKRELKRLRVPVKEWPDFVGDGMNSRSDATTHFFENNKDKDIGLCAIVCIKASKSWTTAGLHGLIVHEAVHIWQFVCKELGERNPGPEFEAYSIQAISQNLISAYNNKKKGAR